MGSEEALSENMAEFYAGALLAARDLGSDGSKLDLSVCNTSRERPSAAGKHLSIGPVASADIDALLRTTTDQNFYVVSPLDPRVEKMTDSLRVIQVPTPASVQARALVEWMLEDMAPMDTILVVRQTGEAPDEFSSMVVAGLRRAGVEFKSLTYDILEAMDIPEKYAQLAPAEGTARIFAATASESFSAEVIRNVNLLQYKERKGVLYCNSRIRSFQSVETENIHAAETHMVANYHIDYTDPEVKRFVYAFRALYGCEPGSFAFQGYDVLRYFCSLVIKYGSQWAANLENEPSVGLQAAFDFKRDSNKKGAVNSAVHRIIYNQDYSISTK